MSRVTIVRARFPLFALLLLFLGSAVTTVTADEPRYIFLEGGWVRDDPEEADTENGWFAGGSFSTRRFHFFGEYRDPGSFEVYEAGGGWHGLMGEKADLVAEAAYVDADFDEGYRASGGLRWMIVDDFEINFYLNHIDIGDFENETISAGGLWEFGRRWGLGGEYEFGDEADTARVFGRFYFRKDT